MRYLLIEADELGLYFRPHGSHERFGDHGIGILMTIAHNIGIDIDAITLKAMSNWAQVRETLKGYDVVVMNVRSWRFENAVKVARVFKMVNPAGQVWVGGFHATVAKDQMLAVPQFDVVVAGAAEETWKELLANGGSPERFIQGKTTSHLDNLPFIDRSLWPKTPGDAWPLEHPGELVPGTRAATIITGRMCPFHCSFCYPSEKNHFKVPARRSVDNVMAELSYIENKWGDYQSVIFHDSEFLMNPTWLEEFLQRYPTEGKRRPFWASCRADMMAKWPKPVERLHKEANWHTVSIGFESGSQRVLDMMNKETTVEQNDAGIDFINRLGDEAVAEGRTPPVVYANVMFAVPGEEPEDAFATVRMLGRIKRCIPSVAWFTPYPGNTLGDKLIAEGRSLIGTRYTRFANEPKVAGVNYQFYIDLMSGKYDAEIGVPFPRPQAA